MRRLGLGPIFYHALRHVPPAEVLAHRTLWSLVLFGIILTAQGRLTALPRALVSGHWAGSSLRRC